MLIHRKVIGFLSYYSSSIPLQGFDKHGRRVLILRGSRVDPDKFTMIDQFRANLMVNELLMKECDDEQGNFLNTQLSSY